MNSVERERKIVIFSAQYLPHMGGVETFTSHIAAELVELGCDVSIVCLAGDIKEPKTEIEDSEVTVYRFPAIPLLSGRYPISLATSDIRSCVESISPSHIVINARFYPHSVLGAIIARKQGLVPIIIEHGSAHLVLGNKLLDKSVALIEHSMTKAIKATRPLFFGVSHSCNEWLKHFGIKSSGTIQNAIDADFFVNQGSGRSFRCELGIEESAFIVSFIGRLVPEKGVSQLLDAARLVPECHFIFAGEGPLKKKLVNESPINVHYVGRLSSPDTSALLQQANLFCLPSRSEGFATTLLEASACGTPSLVTNVGGSMEIIPNEDYGTIVGSADPCLLAKEIKRLINDHELLLHQGRNVYKLTRDEFSWKSTAKALLEACSASQATKSF